MENQNDQSELAKRGEVGEWSSEKTQKHVSKFYSTVNTLSESTGLLEL